MPETFTFDMRRDAATIELFLDAAKHNYDVCYLGMWWRIDPPHLPNQLDGLDTITFIGTQIAAGIQTKEQCV